MRSGFNVTYDIVTPESAEHGDYAECGFIAENIPLRMAIDALFETRTSRVSGIETIEANECPVEFPYWLTVVNGMEFETGACESRSLHFPDWITGSSRRRIARLIGCYGV